MNRVWETDRGDEWWYEDYWCKASANRAANIVSISYVQIAQGQLNEERLHEFLSLSRKRFEGETILLNVSTAEVFKALAGLAERGIVEFERIASSYSKEARITKLQIYEKPQVQMNTPKKKWLGFW